MGCPENITNLTREQLSANGRKGAAITNAKKRQKKAMREQRALILSLPIKRSVRDATNKLLTVDKAKALDDFSRKNTTVQTQIMLKLTQMAMSGNLKAMALIIELSGETNQKTVDTSALDRLDTIIGSLKDSAMNDKEG